MARLARAELFDSAEIAVVHCINRCVRRCFLCGDDPVTGCNFDNRKATTPTGGRGFTRERYFFWTPDRTPGGAR